MSSKVLFIYTIAFYTASVKVLHNAEVKEESFTFIISTCVLEPTTYNSFTGMNGRTYIAFRRGAHFAATKL